MLDRSNMLDRSIRTARVPSATGASGVARALVSGIRLAVVAAVTLGVVGVGIGATGASAAQRDIGARYKVSYGSLPMGRLDANLRIDGGAYALDARFESGGLARLMKSTTGNVSVGGAISPQGPVPARFAMDYRSGSKSRARSVQFGGGRVSRFEETPARPAPANWVPLTQDDFAGAIDPASAFLVASPGGSPCGSRLRLFDGRTRIDIAMSPAGSHRFRAKGFSGRAVKCKLSAAPVAGYKRGKTEKAFGRLRNMTASFVPVPGTALHMMVQIEAGTSIGKFSARATELKL